MRLSKPLWCPKGERIDRCPTCESSNITSSPDGKMWRCNNCDIEWEMCYYGEKKAKKVKAMSPEEVNKLRRKKLEA